MKFLKEMTEHGVKEAQETVFERLFGRSSRAHGIANDNKYVRDLKTLAAGVARSLVKEKGKTTCEGAAIMLINAIEAIKKTLLMVSRSHRLQSPRRPTLTLSSSQT